MPRTMRIPLVLAAVLAAVGAFVVLRPDDDSSSPSDRAATVERQTPAEGRTATKRSVAGATPTPAVRRPPLLTADHVRTLSFRRGETIAFRVRHSVEEEIHVHGYDISRRLPAGRTVNVRFPAELEGIFEVELEHSATPLGRLRVDP